jgi:hypothetical protein
MNLSPIVIEVGNGNWNRISPKRQFCALNNRCDTRPVLEVDHVFQNDVADILPLVEAYKPFPDHAYLVVGFNVQCAQSNIVWQCFLRDLLADAVEQGRRVLTEFV